MEEKWKTIRGYEGLYQISNYGRVRTFYKFQSRNKQGSNISQYQIKYLKPQFVSKKEKYLKVVLVKNKNKKNYRIHRLVANEFIPNPNNCNQINHINGNKQDNRVSNLEWCDTKENINHAYDNNLMKHKRIKMIKSSGNIIIFNRRGEIEKYYGRKICQDLITRCCNGKRKTAYGCKWEYLN